MIAAGPMDRRVRFERRAEVADGAGNTRGEWRAIATRWASYRPEFGREAVAAGRLQSTRAGTLTVRRDSMTTGMTAADRVMFVAGPDAGTTAQIRSVIPLTDSVEMTIEMGVAS